jgi:large subunit ribosomal protein L3
VTDKNGATKKITSEVSIFSEVHSVVTFRFSQSCVVYPQTHTSIMKFLLATKQEMTQYFTPEGKVVAATLLSAGPLTVTDVRTMEKDGYAAVQVGFGTRLPKRVKKPQQGALKELGSFRWLREYRPKGDMSGDIADTKRGDTITAEVFSVGDAITASGISKGKGFQGVVKRHGFKGGSRSHGQKHSEREPGSIGATGPQRVIPGTRMAGRMGGDRTTIKNLRVLLVDPTNNLLLVSGAIPGRRGTLIELRG